MIVNLGSKKGDRNGYSSPKINNIQNSLLLLSIVYTPENNVSHGDGG